MTAQKESEPLRLRGLGFVVGLIGLVMVIWSILIYVEMGVAVGSPETPEFSLGLQFLIDHIAKPLWGLGAAPAGSVSPMELVAAVRRTIWICLGLGAFLAFSGIALGFRRNRRSGS